MSTKKYLDESGLTYFWNKSKNKFVAKENGKGLSTNDYTTAEKTKLTGIQDEAEVNVITSVSVNGTGILPDEYKNVDISVPTLVTSGTSSSNTNAYSCQNTNTQINTATSPIYDELSYKVTKSIITQPTDALTLTDGLYVVDVDTNQNGILYLPTSSSFDLSSLNTSSYIKIEKANVLISVTDEGRSNFAYKATIFPSFERVYSVVNNVKGEDYNSTFEAVAFTGIGYYNIITYGGSDEIAISTTEPTGDETLWINPDEMVDDLGSYVSNTYGTSQQLAYSQEYSNNHNVNVGTSVDTDYKVNFLKGKNLLDLKSQNISNPNSTYLITNSNEIIVTSTGSWGFAQVDTFNVKTNTNYVLSCNLSNNQSVNSGIIIYDTNGNTLNYESTTDQTKTLNISFSSTTSTIKIKFAGNNTMDNNNNVVTYSNIQLEEGSTATSYEPYITPSINVNGDEIYNSNVMNYSTGEQVIGKWIDGKPLYRKVLVFPNGTGTTSSKTYTLSNYGINNVDEIFMVHPSFYTLDNLKIPFNFYDGTQYTLQVSNQILIVTLGYSAIANSRFVITLEYTKTTD